LNARRRLVADRPLDDAELLSGIAAGDLGALGELYQRYARDVWRAACRCVPDGIDAEDVVHATFMKLPAIAPSYDGRANCRSWLCGIAVRLAMRQRRGVGRLRRMLSVFAQEVVHLNRDPEQKASGNQGLAMIERALERLSEKKRLVFMLVELEGLSIDECAHALEIPPATVRTRLFHARRELQGAMREGGASS
jgi:RNA polymerase sigma-70 factor (ECF subfamily)